MTPSLVFLAVSSWLQPKTSLVFPRGKAQLISSVLACPRRLINYSQEIDEQKAALFTASYSAQFRAQDSAPCEFFDGVLETLSQLRAQGCLLAVATGKSRAGLDRVLSAMNMSTFFDGSRCADETLSKPNPLMIKELLAELLVSPDEAVMVGDTEFDLEMAQNAGVRSIAMTYGAHSKKRLAAFEPMACLDNFTNIVNYL